MLLYSFRESCASKLHPPFYVKKLKARLPDLDYSTLQNNEEGPEVSRNGMYGNKEELFGF